MKAAVIRETGATPAVAEIADPSGEVVEVLAAPINPIDLAVSRGILATGHPELPYVPGCEGVGRTADGRVVWIFGGSFGRTTNGAMGALASVGDAFAIDVPDGADPAWQPGSASPGSPGGCRSRGARRSRAARTSSCSVPRARSVSLPCRPRSSSAHAASWRQAEPRGPGTREGLGGRRDDPPRRGRRSRRHLQGRVRRCRPELRVRPPLGRACGCRGTGGRAAGDARQPRPVGRRDVRARLGPGRFKNLSILGHTNFAVREEELADHYRRLVGHVMAGDIVFDVERVPIDDVASAWQRQADGAGAKLVLVP